MLYGTQSRRSKLYYHLLLIVIFICSSSILAQKPNLRFEHFTTANGLPSLSVQAIVQDELGFLWFGTSNGLARYDGYQFKSYKLDSSKTNPSAGVSITTLVMDSAHCIWAGTDHRGLFRLQLDNGSVKHYYASGDSTSISSNKIRHLHLDKENYLWIIYQDSLLDRLHLDTDRLDRFRSNPEDSATLSSNKINIWNYRGRANTVFTETRHGHIWIATRNSGVNLFNPQLGNFTRFGFSPSDTTLLSHIRVTQIFEDSEHNIWLSTDGGGLNLYQPESNTFKHFKHDPNNPSSITSNRCFQIIEDPYKNLWIGTPEGLEKYNLHTKKFSHYQHNPDDQTSIAPDMTFPFCVDKRGHIWSKSQFGSIGINSVLNPKTNRARHFFMDNDNPQSIRLYYFASFCQDHSGILWFGTQYLGLNKMNIFAQGFTHHRGDLVRNTGLPSSRINSLAQLDSDPDHIWVGMREGIYRYNLDSNRFTILPEQMSDEIGDKIVHVDAIVQDREGIIWIAAYSSGLIRLEKGKPLKCYSRDYTNPNSLSNNNVQRLTIDKNGKLWIATQFTGVDYFDPETKVFTNYRHNPKDSTSLSNNLPLALNIDSQGIFWAGTWNGLNRFKLETKSFERYFKDTGFYCIHEDRRNNFWLGTMNRGLIKFNRETHEATFFSTANGLPDNTIGTITEDDDGFLWLATNGGLCRFNPETFECVNFYLEHGLPTLYLTEQALKLKNGKIWLGTWYDGIVTFDPNEITINTIPPKMALTDIRLFDISLIPDKDSPLKQDITLTREIQFKHWQNDISIEMAALHFAHPQRNRYMYWLENYDETWRDNGFDRIASYTNLDPGDYIFHAKGANSHGIWNEEPISLRIVIHPPFWATAWAYAFYILLFGGIVITTWKLQARRIKMRHDLEKQEFETAQLKKVDHLKSQFFANMSHEFRTPLTLIKGPLEKLIAKNESSDDKKTLNLMRRNIVRLQRLINYLLDFSAIEAGRLQLNPSTEDVVRLVQYYVQSFESHARLKQIQLTFSSSRPSFYACVDRAKMEDIIYNLVSNALKFTRAGGEVKIHLAGVHEPSKDGGEWFEIRVSDTGIGIPADKIEHVFDRFYQVDDSSTRHIEGSGIGLSLTKELVELHGGAIDVHSAPGVGSVFNVRMPVGDVDFSVADDHFEPLEIVDAAEGEQSPEKTTGRKPMLLIVEDNSDLRAYIRDVLRNGYQFREAPDGKAGFELALKHIPDLIISDVMMPEMDGYELCKKLKTHEETSHIPVILLTARASKESKLEGLETGADDYLIKPFDAVELNVRVKNLISQRKRLQEQFAKKISADPKEIAVTSADERFLQKALEIIEDHISDAEFDAESFAAALSMSRSMLHRKLRGLTGLSTSAFIRSIRLKRAAQLIRQKSGSISEIAYQVGFNHLSYFAECFKKQFGVNPKEFK